MSTLIEYIDPKFFRAFATPCKTEELDFFGLETGNLGLASLDHAGAFPLPLPDNALDDGLSVQAIPAANLCHLRRVCCGSGGFRCSPRPSGGTLPSHT